MSCFGVCSYNVLAPSYVRTVDIRLGTIQPFAAFEWCDDASVDWSLRRPKLIARVRGLLEKCNVLALQEVEFESLEPPAWLREAAPDWTIVVPKMRDLERNAERNLRVLGKRVAVGNAIVTKNVKSSKALSSTSLVVEVDNDWVVANVHLDAGSEQKRVDTMMTVVAAMRSSPSKRLVVCGDLNSELSPGSPLGSFVVHDDPVDVAVVKAAFDESYGFDKDLDAWHALYAATMTASALGREYWRRVDTGVTRAAYDHNGERSIATWRLDHILYDDARAVLVSQAPTLEDADDDDTGDALRIGLPNAVEPSDHFPVLATFRPVDSDSGSFDSTNLWRALDDLRAEEAVAHAAIRDIPVDSSISRGKNKKKKSQPLTEDERAEIQRQRQLLKDTRAANVDRRRAFVRTHLTDRHARDWFDRVLFDEASSWTPAPTASSSSKCRNPSAAFIASPIDDWVLSVGHS